MLDQIETNDCTVWAIKHAYDIPYEKAHDICARYGREPRQGFHIQAQLLNKLGLKILPWFTDRKVKDISFDPTKTYLVLVKGHIFCVKLGRIMDTLDNSEMKTIRVFEVPSPKELLKFSKCKYCGTNGEHYCPNDIARD